jgi:hypothetical protein
MKIRYAALRCATLRYAGLIMYATLRQFHRICATRYANLTYMLGFIVIYGPQVGYRYVGFWVIDQLLIAKGCNNLEFMTLEGM